MMFAALPVRDQDVLELARLLRKSGSIDTAERLENAYDVECNVLALTIPDRRRSSQRSTTRPTASPNSAACSFASTSGADAKVCSRFDEHRDGYSSRHEAGRQ